MKNKKEKLENWEKLVMRIEKITLDCHLNSISQEEARDEILELLKSEKEELLEKIKLEKFEILEGNKYKKGKEEGLFVQTNYALGYNQAIADLEKLKEEIRKP